MSPIMKGLIMWRTQANCKDTNPNIWFPSSGEDQRRLKRICDVCTVRKQCLDDALSEVDQYGYRAGFSERARRKLRRRLPLAVRTA